MSYSLAFWKYKEGVYLDNQLVYESVIGEGKQLDELQLLPTNEIRILLNRQYKLTVIPLAMTI